MLKYLLVIPGPWGTVWPGRGKVSDPSRLVTHNLAGLWVQLDRSYPRHPLDEFKPLVENLNRWEHIRYAQLTDAGTTHFTHTLEHAASSEEANKAQPGFEVYAVDIERLDRMFRAFMDFIGIIERLGSNPVWLGE